jgi:hypothetical protein
VRADHPGPFDIGDRHLQPAYVPRAAANYAADAFHNPTPLPERLAKGSTASRALTQNLLVLIGSPNQPAVHQLFDFLCSFDSGNADLDRALADYRIMPIDIADPAAKPFVAGLGINWPKDGAFNLAAFDPAAGRLLAQTTEAEISANGKIDPALLLNFARLHSPVMPDAQQLFETALGHAKKDGKCVLLDESGAGCGWCIKLADYLSAHRATIDKAFVWVTLDRRFKHGTEILDRYRTSESGGVPWTAILDSDGKLLITSDSPTGNIGYPGGDGAGWWEKMLRSGTPKLSDADIQSLVDPLR